jgi:hypothetical protein
MSFFFFLIGSWTIQGGVFLSLFLYKLNIYEGGKGKQKGKVYTVHKLNVSFYKLIINLCRTFLQTFFCLVHRDR